MIRENLKVGVNLWTYTAYILNRFGERNGYSDMKFKELSEFIFDNLWRKQHLVFHDGKEDLMCDLRYLDKIKVIKLEEYGPNINKSNIYLGNRTILKKASEKIEESALRTGLKLFDEYKEKIDSAFEQIKKL